MELCRPLMVACLSEPGHGSEHLSQPRLFLVVLSGGHGSSLLFSFVICGQFASANPQRIPGRPEYDPQSFQII